jgi:hypothetical protein
VTYDYDERQKEHSKQLLDAEGKVCQEVAETILKIIETPSPGSHYVVGREKRYVTLKRILTASMIESRIRKHGRIDA